MQRNYFEYDTHQLFKLKYPFLSTVETAFWAFKSLSRLAICISILTLAAPSVTKGSHVIVIDLGYAKYAGNTSRLPIQLRI